MCVTVFFGLRAPSVRAWFSAERANRIDGAGWTTPLVLVGALLTSASAIRDYVTETSIASFFPVHTRFEFRDASTGTPINSIGYSSDGLAFSKGRRDPSAPRLSIATRGGNDGMSVELTGLSGRPVDVTFTSDGYLPSKYTLNAKSPDNVTLRFQPSK